MPPMAGGPHWTAGPPVSPHRRTGLSQSRRPLTPRAARPSDRCAPPGSPAATWRWAPPPTAAPRAPHHLLEATDLGHREVAIDLGDPALHGRRQAQRLAAAGAQQQADARHVDLAVRQVDARRRGAEKGLVAHPARDSDDRVPGLVVFGRTEADALAERAAVRPVAAGGALGADGEPRGPGPARRVAAEAAGAAAGGAG